jgi:hypothetical protein
MQKVNMLLNVEHDFKQCAHILKKRQKKKSTWDGTWIEKKNPLMHHPSMLVHW